jgi:transcriptional regulator with XRE-family HTH domain
MQSQSKLFGKRVRAIRRAAKITQEDAAERAQLNAKYLGEIERGEKRPSFDAIVALAKALHVSPALLFQFDREDGDERALRKKIETLVNKSSTEQLQQAYRVLKALTEP